MKWQELDPKAQRKALILGGLVALALLILIWPSGVSRQRSPARPKPTKPTPMPVVHAAPAQAPPDPLRKLAGKWQGGAELNRGWCRLWVELRPGADPNSFSAFTTFSCNKLPLANGGNAAAIAEAMRRALNPTSASFSGTEEGGAIVLHATDNIGVGEAFQGCDMASMTLKPFGNSGLTARWQESGQGVCTGGEMLLVRAQ